MSKWYDSGDDLQKFLLMEEICIQLMGVFSHSRDESLDIFKKFCYKYPDFEFEDFSHKGAFDVALEMHYSIVMGLKIFLRKFNKWRAGNSYFFPDLEDVHERFREKLCVIFGHSEIDAKEIVNKFYDGRKDNDLHRSYYLQTGPTSLAVWAQSEVFLKLSIESPAYLEWRRQLSPKDWSI